MLAIAVVGVATRNAVVATRFLQACSRTVPTTMWTLDKASGIADPSLAICTALDPTPHPSWDPALLWSLLNLSPGCFLMLSAMIICVVRLLEVT